MSNIPANLSNTVAPTADHEPMVLKTKDILIAYKKDVALFICKPDGSSLSIDYEKKLLLAISILNRAILDTQQQPDGWDLFQSATQYANLVPLRDVCEKVLSMGQPWSQPENADYDKMLICIAFSLLTNSCITQNPFTDQINVDTLGSGRVVGARKEQLVCIMREFGELYALHKTRLFHTLTRAKVLIDTVALMYPNGFGSSEWIESDWFEQRCFPLLYNVHEFSDIMEKVIETAVPLGTSLSLYEMVFPETWHSSPKLVFYKLRVRYNLPSVEGVDSYCVTAVRGDGSEKTIHTEILTFAEAVYILLSFRDRQKTNVGAQ